MRRRSRREAEALHQRPLGVDGAPEPLGGVGRGVPADHVEAGAQEVARQAAADGAEAHARHAPHCRRRALHEPPRPACSKKPQRAGAGSAGGAARETGW